MDEGGTSNASKAALYPLCLPFLSTLPVNSCTMDPPDNEPFQKFHHAGRSFSLNQVSHFAVGVLLPF